jgi:sugar/nucleoside kinase (ribokinase family)
MIVVVGNPIGRAVELGGGVDGIAARTAIAAARGGREVQLVGKTGEDPLGDAVLMALAAAGVGHVAMLRDPDHPTPLAVPVEAAAPPSAMLDGDDETAHVVVPADPGDVPTLEAADVELALRYLPDQRVIVIAEPQPDAVVAVVAEAADYAGARLVLVASASSQRPARALVIEPPADGSDGMFGSLLGELAVLLDSGASPDEALRGLAARAGATRPGE